jgi:hypothetical protein
MAVQSGSERLRPWRFLLCAGRDSEVRVCGDFVSSSTTSAWDLSTETLAATRKEERRAAGPLRTARAGSGRARAGMLFSRSWWLGRRPMSLRLLLCLHLWRDRWQSADV